MPLKLNVGLSKKVGLPDYGSLGASCHVEVELDGTLLQNDLDGFHERASRAFAACRQAVNDELARHHGGQQQLSSGALSTAGTALVAGRTAGDNGSGNGKGGVRTGSAHHCASSKQLDYAQQLAEQVRGLGVRQLETLTLKMFGKPVADLSSLDASGLIDTLKAMKAGEINVQDALRGAAA